MTAPADWAARGARSAAGSLVIVRARDAKARAARWPKRFIGLAPALLIADDPALAAISARHGLHLPEARMREAAHWRARHPDWLITASAHSLRALMRRAHADAVFLSPVFATASHPDAPPLTPVRAALIARACAGAGLCAGRRHAAQCRAAAPAFSGIAAIGSLL